MRKPILVLMCTVSIAALGLNAEARGGSGGGFGGGFSHGTPTGPSSPSRSIDNSNGRFALDRDRGLERAEDRMSDEGLAHEKASDARKKRGEKAPVIDPAKERISPRRE